MATSITAKFLNRDKREAEALTVTLPSVLDAGGGRTQAPVVYAQFDEDYVATVVPKESIIGKSYIVVEEAFAALSTATVVLDGTTIFTAVAITTTGILVSASEDLLVLTGGDITITISGGTGDILVGQLKVVNDYTPYTLKNGRFSDVPTV